MNKIAFKSLVQLIRVRWTNGRGLLIRLRHGSSDPCPLRLTVGPDNKGLVAEVCSVWDGDDRVYKGRLDDEQLRILLTEKKTCYGEVVNIQPRTGAITCETGVCFGCAERCRRRGCEMKRLATGADG